MKKEHYYLLVVKTAEEYRQLHPTGICAPIRTAYKMARKRITSEWEIEFDPPSYREYLTLNADVREILKKEQPEWRKKSG